MKRTLLFLFIIGLGGNAFSQNAFTLQEAVQYALVNNPQYKIKALDIKDAETDIKEFTAIGLPKVNASVDYSYYFQLPVSLVPSDFFPPDPSNPNQGEFAEVAFGTKHNLTAGIEVTQLVFDGSFFIGLQAQRLYKKLVEKQVNLTAYEIRSNVSLAYITVLIAIKGENQLNRNIANLEKTLKETSALYENGFVEKLDVERLELSLTNLKVEKEKVLRQIQTTYNVLKYQMGYPLNEDIAISDELDQLVNEFITEPIKTDEKIDLSKRPEYILLQAREEINLLNVKRMKASYLPSLVGFASHQQNLQRDKLFKDNIGWLPSTIAGFSLQIPIFDGFDRKAKKQSAEINVERIRLETKEFERGVSLQVMNAKTDLINAKQTLENRERTVALAENIYEKTRIKYREGVGSSLEVTQAERELYEAQDNYITGLYDLLLAKTNLDIATGDLN